MPDGFAPPEAKVTAVAVVPFLDDGRIVVAQLDRGPDIPGGHVQVDDESLEAAARREALEEAGVELGDLRVIQVVSSDFYGSAPEDLTYLVTMTGIAKKLRKFSGSAESRGRVVMSVDEFASSYSAGDAAAMAQLVRSAHSALFDT